jgi:hypothetical protein
MSISIPILLVLLTGAPAPPASGAGFTVPQPGDVLIANAGAVATRGVIADDVVATDDVVNTDGVVITGRVLDRLSGYPLPGADLGLLGPDPDSTVAWQGRSGPDGVFRSVSLPEGTYLARVSLDGYRTLEWDIVLEGTGELELEISLVSEAIELEPVVVEVRRRSTLERTGFLERRRAGIGYSLDRAQIEEARPLEPSDLLRRAPGVSLVPGPPGHGLVALMRGGCTAQIVLDGSPLGATVSIDDLLGVGDVEGIEVHGAASQPAQFSRGACGSILLWTRDGRDPGRGEPWNRTRTVIVALLFTLTALLGRLTH